MYRIPDNNTGAINHFQDYAEKVKLVVSDYYAKQSSEWCKKYTGKFLERVISSDTTLTNTGSLLEILLIGDFRKQKDLIILIDKELDAEKINQTDVKNVFMQTMSDLFVDTFYNKNTFFNKNKHIERVGVEVCPYCGRNYVFSVKHPTKSNPNTRIKPQIDHFLPKSEYPYLALNYYNLIPSCSTCNERPSKGTNDPIGNDRVHEYLMQPREFRSEDIEFSYIPNTSFYRDFSVKVDMKCSNPDLNKGYK